MDNHAVEVDKGERFQFGRNWQAFLSVLDDERIHEAEESLKNYLGLETLDGLSFLDIGSGSGLFSLVARRLGARVHSFDYDPHSVACTKELKRRYFSDDESWTIEEASVLDTTYISKLGKFDIVYSWGVLHHTGSMWAALENASELVKDSGILFIAIYNYQRYWTKPNTLMKKAYNKSPLAGKIVIAGSFIIVEIIVGLVRDVLFLKNPIKRYIDKKKSRGMSMWYDWIDWVGGYPFEAAKPEEIFDFYHAKGFQLEKLRTTGGGYGCNEYVFKRTK